jgi:hypothetical protein
MTNRYSGMQRVAPIDRGASTDSGRQSGSARTGATIIKLLQRIERLEARAPARIDIEADIQAASAILSEPDIWRRDSLLAQEAMIALCDVYGLEALVLAPH